MSSLKPSQRALRKLTLGFAKTAGRNSAGRITSFHRGGGVKRLQRIIDVKRNTPRVGIVERIEYDPNRSSRIALVRWVEGVRQQQERQQQSPTKEAVAAAGGKRSGIFSQYSASAVRGLFAPSSSLPGKLNESKAPSYKISSGNSVSLFVDGRSFHSLSLQSGASQFPISCVAKPETINKVGEIVRKQALPVYCAVTRESKFPALGANSLGTGHQC